MSFELIPFDLLLTSAINTATTNWDFSASPTTPIHLQEKVVPGDLVFRVGDYSAGSALDSGDNQAISEFNCVNSDTLTVFVNPLPEIIEVDKETNGQFEIFTESEATPLTYTINDTLTQDYGLFNNLETGKYNVTIIDNNGCKYISIIDIYVEIPVIIPTIFTPNGDGINDTWRIRGLQQFAEGTIYILNRNGKLLSKYNIADEHWNGTYNGTPLKPDTYWYIIEVESATYKGHVTIKK